MPTCVIFGMVVLLYNAQCFKALGNECPKGIDKWISK